MKAVQPMGIWHGVAGFKQAQLSGEWWGLVRPSGDVDKNAGRLRDDLAPELSFLGLLPCRAPRGAHGALHVAVVLHLPASSGVLPGKKEINTAAFWGHTGETNLELKKLQLFGVTPEKKNQQNNWNDSIPP